MTNEQLLRYFQNRPSLTKIHLVGTVVFVDKLKAEKYAGQMNDTVQTKTKKEVQDAFADETLNLRKISKREAELNLKRMTLNKQSNYKELQLLAEALGVKPASKSKKNYLDALNKVKEALASGTDEVNQKNKGEIDGNESGIDTPESAK